MKIKFLRCKGVVKKMPVDDRIRYETITFLMKHFYRTIVLEESYTLLIEEQRLLDSFIDSKLVKRICLLMKMMKYIIKYAENLDIQIKPIAILCRHHLKKVKRDFRIYSESTLELYYSLCNKVVVKTDNADRLMSVNALYNCPETLSMIKREMRLACTTCKKLIDYQVNDHHYIIDDTYIYCEETDSFMCKDCFLKTDMSMVCYLKNDDIYL